MAIYNSSFSLSTSKHCQMTDITRQVQQIIEESGITDGSVCVYCPHTTAAITINENADPDVVHDILLTLEELVPHLRSGYQHAEGNSDAHVKTLLTGRSETVLIGGGKMLLGTWQSIFFCEYDGARTRKVLLQITGE